MTSSETFMVLGGAMILSTIALSVNRSLVESSRVRQEAALAAASLAVAEGFLQETAARQFDERVVGLDHALLGLPESLTPPASLGPDSGETDWTHFDDVDDSNGYLADLAPPEAFFPMRVEMRVGYVDSLDLDRWVNWPTLYKRVEVTVTSSFVSAPIRYDEVVSYGRY